MSQRPAGMSRIGLPVLVAWAALIALPCRFEAREGPQAPPPALRLPAAIVYSHSIGPDSAVSFNHDTHVALAGNRCLGCHPSPFRMLAPSRRTTHVDMKAGGSCGRCHDGRHAFGVSDLSACQTCHAGSRPQTLAVGDTASGAGRSIPRRSFPPAITFVRGEPSPGLVTFGHATHTKARAACGNCHPKPFAMKASGARPGGAMHGPDACGSCHDGARAFGVEDAAACERCHAAAEANP